MQQKGAGTKRKWRKREKFYNFLLFCFNIKNGKPRNVEKKEKLKIFQEVDIICVILCMKCIEKVFLVQNLISWHIICR